MSVDFADLSDDELMEQWTTAAQTLEATKQAVKDFSAEYQSREAKRAAQEKYDAMGDEEREALAQIFEAEGIESEEQV